MKKKELVIGPSIGWIFAQGVYPLAFHKKYLVEAKASAAEMVMYFEENQRQQALLNGDSLDVPFITVHLDDVNADMPPEVINERVAISKKIVFRHKAQAAVVHPVTNPESFYAKLMDAGVPVAIENMDKEKPCGYHPRELWHLMEKFGLSFVLDTLHAWDHGADMRYAMDLFDMGRTRLCYLHVSGQSKENIHSLVHKAEPKNAKSIVEFIGKVLSQIHVPIILEGKFITAIDIKDEIAFLKKELGF